MPPALIREYSESLASQGDSEVLISDLLFSFDGVPTNHTNPQTMPEANMYAMDVRNQSLHPHSSKGNQQVVQD